MKEASSVWLVIKDSYTLEPELSAGGIEHAVNGRFF